MEERLNAQIEQLNNAVNNLLSSLSLNIEHYDVVASDSIKSGQVQKFEFCIEAFWKTLKKYISELHGVELKTPKSVVKKALELEYINYKEYEALIQMINERNELNHTYKQERFEAIRNNIIAHKNIWPRLMEIFQ